MSWRSKWKGISSRIDGLVISGKFYLKGSGAKSSAAPPPTYIFMTHSLISRAEEIFNIIKKFSEDHNSTLEPPAKECIERFIDDYSHLFPSRDSLTKKLEASLTYMGENSAIRTLLTIFVLFHSELESHLSDFSVIAKRLSERAFLHLSRSIIADSSVKNRWIDAFRIGEVPCEKLGGAHLLLHGIWAFKSYTPEERTDLVLQEPIRDYYEVERTSEALVLTEWKIVRDASESEQKAKEALKQARIYAGSLLGGIELRQYRYLVLVSEDRLQEIEDIQEGDIVYRHINIPVNPKPPSRSARARTKRTT